MTFNTWLHGSVWTNIHLVLGRFGDLSAATISSFVKVFFVFFLSPSPDDVTVRWSISITSAGRMPHVIVANSNCNIEWLCFRSTDCFEIPTHLNVCTMAVLLQKALKQFVCIVAIFQQPGDTILCIDRTEFVLFSRFLDALADLLQRRGYFSRFNVLAWAQH